MLATIALAVAGLEAVDPTVPDCSLVRQSWLVGYNCAAMMVPSV